MLDKTHPDVHAYRKDPAEFRRKLYRELRDAYSSLYADDLDEVVQALDKLDQGLHEGYTAELMLLKIQQAASMTEQQYRAKCAKFVRGEFWKRTFIKPSVLHSAEPTKPYEGPMPKRP